MISRSEWSLFQLSRMVRKAKLHWSMSPDPTLHMTFLAMAVAPVELGEEAQAAGVLGKCKVSGLAWRDGSPSQGNPSWLRRSCTSGFSLRVLVKAPRLMVSRSCPCRTETG